MFGRRPITMCSYTDSELGPGLPGYGPGIFLLFVYGFYASFLCFKHFSKYFNVGIPL